MSTKFSDLELAGELVAAYGGAQNIVELDACLTRLRITVKQLSDVDQEKLKQLGALGVVIVGSVAQAIFGKNADRYKTAMAEWINAHPEQGVSAALVTAFGGKENIAEIDACLTRLRISVIDTATVSQDALKELGAKGVVVIDKNVQAIFGKRSDSLKDSMLALLEK